ncbi:MAG: hypothetical protein EP344_06825 [Bacteroidetes bacterium]|nr:MAG: hypothetical protein EP344_06825 [Bacteroidota bacterium]
MLEKCIQQIEKDGYCIIPQVYSPEYVQKGLDLTKQWYEKSKDNVSSKLSALTQNDLYLWNPHYKDYHFLEMFFQPKILQDVLMHFLNDKWFRAIPADQPNYILQNLMGRSSDKQLSLHIDSFIPYHSKYVYMLQAAAILEDQTRDNGCTVVIPGSHLAGEYADQTAFEKAIPVETKAGDLVVWDSRIWHGTLANNTEGTRWSIIAAFSRWWIKQMFNYTDNLPQHIYDQLSDSEKAMVGFCSIAYNDEQEGIDRKRGYDTLLKNVEGYRVKQVPEPVGQ